MPSKSKAQRKFMAAAANNPEFARKAGIPQSVAAEYHSADKRKGMANGGLGAVAQHFYGGVVRALEKARDVPGSMAAGEPIKGKGIGKKTRRKLAKEGWHYSEGEDMWYPPQATLGYQLGTSGPAYRIPRAPEGPITVDMMAPDSIAREIYDKYGIIDPTATRYDLTSQAAMREDPLAHLEADDPARQQYEQWTAAREPVQQAAPRDPASFYTPLSEMQSPQREQLRQHKQRVANILSGVAAQEEPPQGKAMGGLLSALQNPEERGELRRRKGYGMRPVIPQLDGGGNEAQMRAGIEENPGYQMGGLARMAAMRRPGSSMRRGMPGGRGRFGRGMPTGGRRPMNPQMMQRMKQLQQRARMAPRGGGGMQAGGPGGIPGMARPGVMPGRQMVGGEGIPGGPRVPPNLRGFLQKQRMMNRPGGMGQQRKQVGMGDQQGGLSRAMQTQTGRRPISRRAAFPGSRQNLF